MTLAWDPEIDTPATIAVIGGGPTAVEAALYARFLGYFVMLFDAAKVGDGLLGWGDHPIFSQSGELGTWGSVTSSLGLAALEAQAGQSELPQRDAPVTYRQYVEKYLLPVARTDLLHEAVQIHSPILSISRVGCSAHNSVSLQRRAEQEFRVLIDSSKRGEYSQLVDVILDCSELGSRRRGIATGGGMAIGEREFGTQMLNGKRDVQGKERQKFSGKHTLLYGSNLEACVNAVDFMRLVQGSSDTRLTWAIPKRLGAGGKIQLDASVSEVPEIFVAAQAVLESENRNLVSIGCWGIEAMHRNNNWNLKLQSTEEETLEIAVDEFINCSDSISDQQYAEHLQVKERDVITCATGEPHYYAIGQTAGVQILANFSHVQHQIREVFALIGGRSDLDLYTTVKPSN